MAGLLAASSRARSESNPQGLDPRSALPQLGTREHDLAGPARGHERGRLDRARGRAEQSAAPQLGPQGEHLAGVPVGRVRLGEASRRRRPRAPRARGRGPGRTRPRGYPDDADVAATSRGTRGSARRAEVGSEHQVRPAPRAEIECGVEPGDVARVRRDHEDPAPGRGRGGHEAREGPPAGSSPGPAGPHGARAGAPAAERGRGRPSRASRAWAAGVGGPGRASAGGSRRAGTARLARGVGASPTPRGAADGRAQDVGRCRPSGRRPRAPARRPPA